MLPTYESPMLGDPRWGFALRCGRSHKRLILLIQDWRKAERFFGTPDVARVRDFILFPVVAASPDRNQRATSKPTVTLTRNVSSPLAIGTGAAIAADPPCARIGTGGANPESSVIHSTRPSLMPDARA
jgi:hypothetical protein